MNYAAEITQNRIFITQSGFLPYDKKSAVLPFSADSFSVKAADGREVYCGKAEYFGLDKLSDDNVYIADFSGFCESGEYYIESDGVRSEIFTIGNSVYKTPLTLTAKAFYYLRCGCGLDEKYAGVYRHAPCHTLENEQYGCNKIKCYNPFIVDT